jgi:hypothetical protein
MARHVALDTFGPFVRYRSRIRLKRALPSSRRRKMQELGRGQRDLVRASVILPFMTQPSGDSCLGQLDEDTKRPRLKGAGSAQRRLPPNSLLIIVEFDTTVKGT